MSCYNAQNHGERYLPYLQAACGWLITSVKYQLKHCEARDVECFDISLLWSNFYSEADQVLTQHFHLNTV